MGQADLVSQVDLVLQVFHQLLEFLVLLDYLAFQVHQDDPLIHVYPVIQVILDDRDLL